MSKQHEFTLTLTITKSWGFKGDYSQLLDELGLEDSEELQEEFSLLLEDEAILDDEIGCAIEAKLEECGESDRELEFLQ